MKKTSYKFNISPSVQEFFIFLGLLCWLAIIDTLSHQNAGWENYLQSVGKLIVFHIPVLTFVISRAKVKSALGRKNYRISWALCFCLFLPALILTAMFWETVPLSPQLLTTAALCCLLLELLLAANTYYKSQFQGRKYLAKIGVEGWVFIVICLIVAVLSAMAVSSMGIADYDTKQRLLIGYEFNLLKIITGFRDFLVIFFQLLLIYLCGYFLFYLNSRFLVANIFRQQGLMMYVLSALSLIAFLYPFLGQLLIWLSSGPLLSGTFSQNPFSWENAFAAVSVVFLTLPVLLSLQWAKQNSQITELEKQKTTAELDLLKQQLNPHFFFNTLNNLYALSLQKSEQTSESILRLSDLMRYVIYKGQKPYVSLAEEVSYLTDYMQLQKIRLRKKLDFQFDTSNLDSQQMLAPMLLIVFVENAFKHGIEPAEKQASLHLKLSFENSRLFFRCQNSFELQVPHSPGIGLSNLKRRLELLYPDRHMLHTTMENDTFTAVLELDLS